MIEGYALRTADEGLDPEEWIIVVNYTDGITTDLIGEGT